MCLMKYWSIPSHPNPPPKRKICQICWALSLIDVFKEDSEKQYSLCKGTWTPTFCIKHKQFFIPGSIRL
jgi:hypothetical protein